MIDVCRAQKSRTDAGSGNIIDARQSEDIGALSGIDLELIWDYLACQGLRTMEINLKCTSQLTGVCRMMA